MQHPAVKVRALWFKILTIVIGGGFIGALAGVLIRRPNESFETVVVTTLAGLGFGWTIAEYIRVRSGHRW